MSRICKNNSTKILRRRRHRHRHHRGRDHGRSRLPQQQFSHTLRPLKVVAKVCPSAPSRRRNAATRFRNPINKGRNLMNAFNDAIGGINLEELFANLPM